MSSKVVNVDLSNKRSQNTIVLQNANPNILEVIENATHVVTYNFEGGKWEKGTCEGACFLTKNCMPPYNTVMILNKMGIENFSMDMDSILNMKLQAPYVMVKHNTSAGVAKIVGLWFHDECEQGTFFSAMESCRSNKSSGQQTLQTALSAITGTNAKTGVLKSILSGLAAPASPVHGNPAHVSRSSSTLVTAVQNGASESKTSNGASTGKKTEKTKTTVSASASSSNNRGNDDASEALEENMNTAASTQTPRGQGNAKGKSSDAAALKGMLQKPPSTPAVQYAWVGDRLLPVGTKPNAATDAAHNSDKLLESLSETKYSHENKTIREEDMFTDRGISSVQARAAFEVPEGIDGTVAVQANNSYLEATKSSAKKEASIPAHHLQAGGVGSSVFFADSHGAVTLTASPPVDGSISAERSAPGAGGNAINKTSLLKTVLSFGSLNSGAHCSFSTIVHASSTGSLSAIAASDANVAAAPATTPKAVPPPRKSASFLSPSDLMKMTGRQTDAKK